MWIDFDLWVSWESVIWLIVSWLIDWQKRYIEDGWVGKEKFDWFNDDERNQWKKEWIRFIWFWFDLIDCHIELIEMNEKALNALWLSSC